MILIIGTTTVFFTITNNYNLFFNCEYFQFFLFVFIIYIFILFLFPSLFASLLRSDDDSTEESTDGATALGAANLHDSAPAELDR